MRSIVEVVLGIATTLLWLYVIRLLVQVGGVAVAGVALLAIVVVFVYLDTRHWWGEHGP